MENPTKNTDTTLVAEQADLSDEEAEKLIRSTRKMLADYDKKVGGAKNPEMPLRLESARQAGYDDQTRRTLKLPPRQ